MRLGVVETNFDSEVTVVLFGPAEANDDRDVVVPQDDAAFVDVTVVYSGLVNGEQSVDDLFP